MDFDHFGALLKFIGGWSLYRDIEAESSGRLRRVLQPYWKITRSFRRTWLSQVA